MSNDNTEPNPTEYADNPGERRIWNELFPPGVDLPDDCLKYLRMAVSAVTNPLTGELRSDPGSDRRAAQYIRKAIEAAKE